MMERFQIILFRLHNLLKEEQKVICMGHTQGGKSLGSPTTFVRSSLNMGLDAGYAERESLFERHSYREICVQNLDKL